MDYRFPRLGEAERLAAEDPLRRLSRLCCGCPHRQRQQQQRQRRRIVFSPIWDADRPTMFLGEGRGSRRLARGSDRTAALQRECTVSRPKSLRLAAVASGPAALCLGIQRVRTLLLEDRHSVQAMDFFMARSYDRWEGMFC
jgi:hypothetical protein